MRATSWTLILLGMAVSLAAPSAPAANRKSRTQASTDRPSTPTAGTTAGISVRFIELQLDADGKGSLRVDCQTNGTTRIAPPKGAPSSLASLDGATVVRLDDGRTTVHHDLATCTNVEDVIRDTPTKEAFALDKERNGLVLKPVKMAGADKPCAQFSYPRPVRLPVTLRMSLANFESDPFCLELQFRQKKYAKLNVYFFNDARKPLGVDVSWFDAEKRSVLRLVTSDLPVNAEVTYGFRCPIDSEHQDPTPFFQRIHREMTIRALDVTARFTARAGVAFTDRKGQVVIGSVFEGPAARAGVRPGDVVLRIDSRPPASVEDAVRIIRDRSPGDTLQLTINREGNELTVPFTAE